METINRRRTVHVDAAIFLAGLVRVLRFAWTAAETGDFRLPVHRADDADGNLSRISHGVAADPKVGRVTPCAPMGAVRKNFAHRRHVTAPKSICHSPRLRLLPTPHRAA